LQIYCFFISAALAWNRSLYASGATVQYEAKTRKI